MQLYCQEYGDGSPVIILHGLLGASGNWHTLSRTVFADHFHVYALDLRNHGRSPHNGVFDYPSMVGDVVAFMDARSLAQAAVLGHSMGGKVGMWLALRHADRVRRLISADMAPRAYPPHHMHLLNSLRSIDLEQYDSRGAIDESLAVKIESLPVRQFLLKNLHSDGEGRYSWKMNLDAIYRNYPRINEGIQTSGRFEKPALFIKGGKSSYITDQDRPQIESLFPNARFAELPAAGHWLHAEAPREFASLVVDFLSDDVSRGIQNSL
jgi:pimeloyl-ACP methyl ester carboxylesterase